jgi:acetyl esterase/lipase
MLPISTRLPDCSLYQEIPDIKNPPQLSGTWSDLRKVLEERKNAAGSGTFSNREGVMEHDIIIPSSDGYAVPVRVYSPRQLLPCGGPLVIMFHGGGWCLGGIESEELNCRRLTQRLGCVCLNVDYRLAPEHPYPAAFNDCWAVTQWVSFISEAKGNEC